MSKRETPWTPEDMLAQLSAAGTPAIDVAHALLAWEKGQPFVEMTGGRGMTNATLRFAVDTGGGNLSRVLLLYAESQTGSHSLELYIQTLLSAPGYNRSPAAEQLVADLRGLGIPRLLDESIPEGSWPGIPLSQLADGRIGRLLALIDRWIDDVRGQSAKP